MKAGRSNIWSPSSTQGRPQPEKHTADNYEASKTIKRDSRSEESHQKDQERDPRRAAVSTRHSSLKDTKHAQNPTFDTFWTQISKNVSKISEISDPKPNYRSKKVVSKMPKKVCITLISLLAALVGFSQHNNLMFGSILIVQAAYQTSPLQNLLNESNISISDHSGNSIQIYGSLSYLFDYSDITYVLLTDNDIQINVDPPVTARTLYIGSSQEHENKNSITCATIKVIDSSGASVDIDEYNKSCYQMRGFFRCLDQAICSNIAKIQLSYYRRDSCDQDMTLAFALSELGLYKEQVLDEPQVYQKMSIGSNYAYSSTKNNQENTPEKSCPTLLIPKNDNMATFLSRLSQYGAGQFLIHAMWNIRSGIDQPERLETQCESSGGEDSVDITENFPSTTSYLQMSFTGALSPTTDCETSWKKRTLYYYRVGFFVSQTNDQNICDQVDLSSFNLPLHEMLYTQTFQSGAQVISWPPAGVDLNCGDLKLKLESNPFLELVEMYQSYEIRSIPGQQASIVGMNGYEYPLRVVYKDYHATPYEIGKVKLMTGSDCTTNELANNSLSTAETQFDLPALGFIRTKINEPAYSYFTNFCAGPQTLTPVINNCGTGLLNAEIVTESGVNYLKVTSLTQTSVMTCSVGITATLRDYPTIEKDWRKTGVEVSLNLTVAPCSVVQVQGGNLGTLSDQLVYTPGYSSSATWTVPYSPEQNTCGTLVIEASKVRFEGQQLIEVTYDVQASIATVSIHSDFSSQKGTYESSQVTLFVNYGNVKAYSDLEFEMTLTVGPNCDINNPTYAHFTWPTVETKQKTTYWTGTGATHLIGAVTDYQAPSDHQYPWCTDFSYRIQFDWGSRLQIVQTGDGLQTINFVEVGNLPGQNYMSKNTDVHIYLTNYGTSTKISLVTYNIQLIEIPSECQEVVSPAEGRLVFPSQTIFFSTEYQETYSFVATNPKEADCGAYQISASHAYVKVTNVGTTFTLDFTDDAVRTGSGITFEQSNLVLENSNYPGLYQKIEVENFIVKFGPNCRMNNAAIVGDIQQQPNVDLNVFRTVADAQVSVVQYYTNTSDNLNNWCTQFEYYLFETPHASLQMIRNGDYPDPIILTLSKDAPLSLDGESFELRIKSINHPTEYKVWAQVNLRVVDAVCQEVTTGGQTIAIANFVETMYSQNLGQITNRQQMEATCGSYAFAIESPDGTNQAFTTVTHQSDIIINIDFTSNTWASLKAQSTAWNTFHLVISYSQIQFATPLKLPFNVINCPDLLASGQERITQGVFETTIGDPTPVIFKWQRLTTTAPSECGGLDILLPGTDPIHHISALSYDQQNNSVLTMQDGSWIDKNSYQSSYTIQIKVFLVNAPTVSDFLDLVVTVNDHPCKTVQISETITLSKLYATPLNMRKVYLDPWKEEFDSTGQVPLTNPKLNECGPYIYTISSPYLEIVYQDDADFTGYVIQPKSSLSPNLYAQYTELSATVTISYDSQYHSNSVTYPVSGASGPDCALLPPTQDTYQSIGTVRIDQTISTQVVLPIKDQPWEYCDLLNLVAILADNRRGTLSINDIVTDPTKKSVDLSNFSSQDVGDVNTKVNFYIENFSSFQTIPVAITITVQPDPCAQVPLDPLFPQRFTKMVYTPSYQVNLLDLSPYSPPVIPPECPPQLTYTSDVSIVEVNVNNGMLILKIDPLLASTQALPQDSTVTISVGYDGLENVTLPQTFTVQFYNGPDCTDVNALPLQIEKIDAIAETPGDYFGVFPDAQSSIGDYPCQEFAYSLPTSPYVQSMLRLDETVDQITGQTNNLIRVSLDQISPPPGIIPFTLETRLKHYPDVGRPVLMPFEVEIFSRANESPTFASPLKIVEIQKDNSQRLPWTFQLPEAKDADGDKFEFELVVGEGGDESVLKWLSVDPESGLLSCEDVNDDSKVPVGQTKLKVKLNDKRDPAEFDLKIEIFPKPPVIIPPPPVEDSPKEEEKEEEVKEEETAEEIEDETAKDEQASASDKDSSGQSGDSKATELTETVSIGGVSFDWTPPKKNKRDEKRKIVPPRIQRFDISPVGLMTIEFSKPILIPDIFRKILDFYEDQEKIEKNAKEQPQRKLGEKEDFDPEKILRGLFGLNLQAQNADDDMTASDLITTMKLTEFKNDKMQIQLEFLDPDQMSPDLSAPDILEVAFVLPKIFVDSQDFQKLPDTISSIKIDIPPQVSQEKAAALGDLNASVESTTQALSLPQILLYTVMAQGLKFLWNVINLLQFLVFMQKWKIKIPYETMIWLKALRSITLFEFIPTKSIVNKVSDYLGIKKGVEEDNDALAVESGTSAMAKKGNILENMGMMLIIGVGMIFAVILLLLFRMFIFLDYRIYRTYQKIKQTIFYNSFIRYVLQSALKLQIASLDTIMAAYLTSETPSLSNLVKDTKLVSPALILLVLWLSPFLFLAVMHREESQLQFVWVKRKIGTLYLGLNPTRGAVKWHSFAFLIRRMTFVGITYSLMSVPGIQIQVFMFASLFYMIFLNHQTYFEDALSLKLDNFNEMLFFVICYFFVLFCNMLSSEQAQLNAGNALIGTVILMIAVNGFFMARFIISTKKHAKKMKKLAEYKAKVEEKRKIKQEALKKQEKVVVKIRKGQFWRQRTIVDIKGPNKKTNIAPQAKFNDQDMLFCPDSDHEQDQNRGKNKTTLQLIREEPEEISELKTNRSRKDTKKEKLKNIDQELLQQNRQQNARVHKFKEVDTFGRQVTVIEVDQVAKQSKNKLRQRDMESRRTMAEEELNNMQLQPSAEIGFKYSQHAGREDKLLKARGFDSSDFFDNEPREKEGYGYLRHNHSVTKTPLIYDQESTNDSGMTFQVDRFKKSDKKRNLLSRYYQR